MKRSRPRKADLILDAAMRVLARDGSSGLTIASVAEEADVSRGLLHYYFRNKEDMLIQMMQRSGRHAWGIMGSIAESAASPQEFADLATKGLREFTENQTAAMILLVEVMAVSRTNPRIRQEFAAIFEKSQERWIGDLQKLADEGKIQPRVPMAGLAIILKALTYGIGLSVEAVPDIGHDEETWKALNRVLLDLAGGS